MLETIGSNDSCYRHGEKLQEECLVCQAICDKRDKMAACKERLKSKDHLHAEVSVQLSPQCRSSLSDPSNFESSEPFMAASLSGSQASLPLSTLPLESIGSIDSCYKHGEHLQEDCFVCQFICDHRDKLAARKQRPEMKNQLHREVSVLSSPHLQRSVPDCSELESSEPFEADDIVDLGTEPWKEYIFGGMYNVLVQTSLSGICRYCEEFYCRKVNVRRGRKSLVMYCHKNQVDMVSGRVCYDHSIFPQQHMTSIVAKIPRLVPLRTLQKLT